MWSESWGGLRVLWEGVWACVLEELWVPKAQVSKEVQGQASPEKEPLHRIQDSFTCYVKGMCRKWRMNNKACNILCKHWIYKQTKHTATLSWDKNSLQTASVEPCTIARILKPHCFSCMTHLLAIYSVPSLFCCIAIESKRVCKMVPNPWEWLC